MSRFEPKLCDGWIGLLINFYCAGMVQLLIREARKRDAIISSSYWLDRQFSITCLSVKKHHQGYERP